MNFETFSAERQLQSEPDHVLELDISSVKTLQIGYHAETIFLYAAEGNTFLLREYIAGLSGSEYYAKVSANRFKTTIRHGRREEVNRDTYVEVFLPTSWHGELSLSSQYGSITTDTDWELERFTTETTEGTITVQGIKAPRIHLSSSVSALHIERAEGFVHMHSVSGPIMAGTIAGGGRLETSGSPIRAAFSSLNTIVECNTTSGDIELTLPPSGGMIIDGASKRGNITSEIAGLDVKTKPGNIKVVTGTLGTKPFQKIRISTINGNIHLA
ncbi:MAG: DUF4097 domain-containing protein [Clostridiales bacterium]|nr:DUF4097 domain-containing protein [Clostridiales bacterium]